MSWWDHRYQTGGMAHRFTLVDDNTSNMRRSSKLSPQLRRNYSSLLKLALSFGTSTSLTRKEIQECLLRLWNTLLGMKGPLRLFNGTALQTAKGYCTASAL